MKLFLDDDLLDVTFRIPCDHVLIQRVTLHAFLADMQEVVTRYDEVSECLEDGRPHSVLFHLRHHRTFNMGCGMIIAVEAHHAEAICEWLGQRMQGVAVIGAVNDAGHKVTHALEGVEFTHY